MRALLVDSELPGTIRGILLADVCADLLQFEPDGRYTVAAGPEMLAREVSLFTGQTRDCDRALAFQKSDHGRHRVLRWNRDTHVDVVWHQVPLNDLALLLFGQGVEDCAQLPPRLAKDGFPSALGHEHHMIIAVPFDLATFCTPLPHV